jgi:hypothetical protein
MESNEVGIRFTDIVARMLEDRDFRQRILTSPVETLDGAGIHLPPEIEAEFVTEFKASISEGPFEQEALTDDNLMLITGGAPAYQTCENRSCTRGHDTPACWAHRVVSQDTCRGARSR